MKCPKCSHMENKVIESRINQSGDITRRRRECLHCQTRFTTYERLEVFLPSIVKKDGRRESFNPEKIFLGLQKACQKRPVTTAQIDHIVSEIERKLASLTVKEIPSRWIGEAIMLALRELDTVAYIRFASVYREFKDVEDFMADLKDLPSKKFASEDSFIDFPTENDGGPDHVS